jgi:hypothetical protein
MKTLRPMDDGRICAVVKGKKGVRKIHALNNCRSLQPNIAIAIAAADSRSNRGSDGVLAFQQKAKEASGCSSMLEWLLATTHKTDFMTFRTHSGQKCSPKTARSDR